ncbi:MAG: hypothetical protein ABII21_04170 [bacterium]
MRKNLLLVGIASLMSLVVFWTPFILKTGSFGGIDFRGRGMETIVQNFDGLNFLVVAKSWYNPQVIEQINAQFLTGNDPIYFAAHFPLFAGIVKFFSLALPPPHALLAAVIVTNVLLAIGLYWFFETTLKNRRLALIMSVIALFFPARMLSVRGVGSNEPLFMTFVLVSLTWAIKEKYWPSAIAGALAVLTRSPGIILFAGYILAMWHKPKHFIPYLIMPLTLVGLFVFYGFRYQDLLAYFHSGDNLHLFFPPFQIFSNMQSWISDMWREDIIYLYVFYGLGLAMVKDKTVKAYGWIYGAILLFVAHRDLGRYALPIAPMALLGYAPRLPKVPKKAWWVMAVLIIPIYLLGWQFILKNIQPISDWGVFK